MYLGFTITEIAYKRRKKVERMALPFSSLSFI